MWQPKLGLWIPQTLVTNNPDQVRAFYEQCGGEVIYKIIGESTNLCHSPKRETERHPPCRWRARHLHLNEVVHAPHLFQKKVAKQFDLRVTIVGCEVFSIRIHSQAAGKASIGVTITRC